MRTDSMMSSTLFYWLPLNGRMQLLWVGFAGLFCFRLSSQGFFLFYSAAFCVC
uniref:Uncharacterized protein n=1 Tax=Arundo donax TaxID=35708 RepID=A0A0A9A7W3_ARUDO